MNKKRISMLIGLIAAAALLVFFFLPRENSPSPSTRVILEHTHHTYIAPSCFDEADATNFLEDSTLEKAEELQYPPHSTCTEESFKGNNDSPFISLLKELGIKEKDSMDW